MCCSPILRTPNFTKPFGLAVDASQNAIGGVLFQVYDGIEHPISYFSRRLKSYQKAYATVEKEALALVTAVKLYNCYFDGSEVICYTDHNPLAYLHSMSNSNNKLLRWSLELQQANLTVVYRCGRTNLLPDILSRPSFDHVCLRVTSALLFLYVCTKPIFF